MGGIPVTINWQADDNERLIYKATVKHAKLILFDLGSRERVEEIETRLSSVKYAHAESIAEYKPAAS